MSTSETQPAGEMLTQVIADLGYLGSHGALAGVAAVIAERRRQVEHGDGPPGEYAAEGALNFGEYARAGALAAAVVDCGISGKSGAKPSEAVSIPDEIKWRYGKFR